MSEYAGICVNMPKYAGMAFVSHFLISAFALQSLFNLQRSYSFESLQETSGYSLKEHEANFLKRQNLIFSITAGSISFVFCF